jgi:two-component system, cell cycle sensor histidine kinase and response regulator CckA
MKRASAEQGASRIEAPDDWLDLLPAAAAVLEPDGTVVRWNREAGTLLGWSAAAAPHFGGRSHWFERLRSAVASTGTGSVLLVRRGRRRPLALEVHARSLADGSLLTLFADRTAEARQRRSREEQRTRGLLRAAHERLRFIADTVLDHAIVTLDGNGCIVSWNGAAERLTGYRAGDVIGQPFSRLYGPDRADLAGMLKLADEQDRYAAELDIVRKDDTVFRAHVTMAAVQEPGRPARRFAVIMRDLTERVRSAEELRRSEDELRHSQKMDAVGRLASGIAHDFNNLITAIRGHVKFVLTDLPPGSASHEDAQEILHAAERAAQLTKQLLTFARRQPSEPAPVDLNTVITGLEKLLRRLLHADIMLETSLEASSLTFVDPGHIEQVIVNLVVNAKDAMPAGGTISVRTGTVRLDEVDTARGLNLEPGEYVQLTVSDNGSGMSADVQRQIFEPFFTTKEEGTGLGLSTVYGIVTQAGGHVFVYSEEGAGTTFKIFLPVHRGTVLETEPETVEPAHEATAEGGSVLLVEDDDAVRGLARRTLQIRGFDVLEATDAEEALRLAREAANRIDCVVTDLIMPKMSGDELATQLAAIRPTVGIVIMSGFEEASLLREGRIRQRRHFLEKPFTPESLVRMVRSAIG